MKRTKARILICVLLCISLISAGALPLFAEQHSETLISTQEGKGLDFPAYETDIPSIDGYFDWDLDRTQPAAAYAPIEDRYLLVYQNSGPALEDNGIIGQFITSDAAVDGDPFPICVRQDTAYNLKLYPDIAYGDGFYVIVWADATFTNFKVLGKIISSDGSFATDVITIDEINPYICENSLSVTYGEGGNFLVAWSDGYNVVERMINPRADYLSDRTQISSGGYFFSSPSVAYSEASDKFLVAWDDNRVSDSDCNIYGRFIGIDGLPTPDEINICTAEHNQFFPSVTYDSSKKEFLLIWVDETGEDSEAVNYGIYSNYFDSNGNPQFADGGESIVEGSDLRYVKPVIEYSSIRDEYLPIWANIPYYVKEQVAPYGSGQQLDKSLDAAGDRLTFGNGIYNRPFPKPAITSSTVEGKYLVVYPCIYADYSNDISVSYLKWELIGEDVAARPGKLQFELENYYADEGAGTARIKVLRTEGLDGQVKVIYATKDYAYPGVASPGADYISVTGILTFESGETEKTFDITIKDDLEAEGTEPIVLELSQPTGGAVLGSITSANLYINDNDYANVSFSSSSYTVTEDVYEQYIDIPVVFSGFPILPAAFAESNTDEAVVFSVVYETSNGTATAGEDYSSASGTLEFGWEGGEKTFRIPIIDDSIDENDETVNLKLSFPVQEGFLTSAGTGESILTDNYTVLLGTPKTAVLKIIDDDTTTSDTTVKRHKHKHATTVVTVLTAAEEVPLASVPPTDALPNDALVGRMPGYVGISTPTLINEVKREINLSYNTATLSNYPGHDARIYYWRPDVSKWVALATYPEGDGKVKALNEGGYTGWFVVFGVVQPHFSDVSKTWEEQLINRMNGLGLIEGYKVIGSDLRAAKPEQKVTRAEFTMFVTRIMNMNPDKVLLPAISESEVQSTLSQAYTDGAEITPWARVAVAKATKAGLVPFEGSGFKPQEPITRIEAAVMVSRALKKFKDFKTIDLSRFKDFSDIPQWAAGEIVENALEGYTDNTLKPNEDIARAESLAMLLRLFVKGLGW